MGPLSGVSSNFARLLWEAATAVPDSTAIEDRLDRTSYEGLAGRAGAFAADARARGVEPGARTAVLMERGADAAAAYFGVLAAGAVAVNVNEASRPRQIEHVLMRAGASVLYASRAILERLPRPLQAPNTQAVVAEDVPDSAPWTPESRTGGDVAQIAFTSGSTGLPKGVTLSHANLWAAGLTIRDYLGIDATDRVAGLLPFSFGYGLNQLVCAVSAAATLVVERSPLAQQIATTLRERAITVLAGVPPLFYRLLGVPAFRDQPIPSLRIMTSAGGRLAPSEVRALRAAQPQAQLFIMYGLTEVTRSTYLPPEEVDDHPDSMGRAIPGAQVMILDEDLRPCPPGIVGELVHRGPTVAMGYWDDPTATARVFRPHPQRPPDAPDIERVVFSGDLVRIDEEGRLYFVGRKDHMIKTLGYRVSPDEISDVLYASEQVKEAAVLGIPDRDRGQAIAAYVVLAPGGSIDTLLSYCRRELPRYMQPARVRVCASLPRTQSGKHDLMALQRSARAATEEP